MTAEFHGLGMDACDVHRLVKFWSAATGCEIGDHDYPYFAILSPSGVKMPRTIVVQVPEEKISKNRLHFELTVDDLEAETIRLVNLGAREVSKRSFGDTSWHVLEDPEGNEFCLVLKND